jgi:hypothetical protein
MTEETITWIPVSERLPDTDVTSATKVLATFIDRKGIKRVEHVLYDDVSFPSMPWMRIEMCNEYEPIEPIAWAEMLKGYEP